MAEGTIICAGVVIAAYIQIGRHVIVICESSSGTTHIGDHVSLSPGANVAAKCLVGASIYVGMGAVALDNLTIGSHAVLGTGAVVTQNVPDRVQVMGVSARIAKENISEK